jgi:hypothetical protein
VKQQLVTEGLRVVRCNREQLRLLWQLSCALQKMWSNKRRRYELVGGKEAVRVRIVRCSGELLLRWWWGLSFGLQQGE